MQKQKQKYEQGQIVRTADFKMVFSKVDSTNYSYQLHTLTQVINDTTSSYRISYLPERFNENLLRSTKLTLEKKTSE